MRNLFVNYEYNLDDLIKTYTESTKNTEQFRTTINTNQDYRRSSALHPDLEENVINEENEPILDSRQRNRSNEV